MNVEQIITDELREVGAAVRPPPPPDPAMLARESDRARTRRIVRGGASILLAAAVVLGAIALGGHLNNPKAAPSPTPQPTELPTGPAPHIPYVKAGILHLDGQDPTDGWASVVASGPGAIAYRGTVNMPATSFSLFYNGVKVRTVVGPTPQGAILSSDGSKVTWVERNPDGTGSGWQLVSYDLATDRELGRIPVDAHILAHVGEETEAWEGIHSLDNDGTVHYGGVILVHTWKPGSKPVTEHASAVPNDLPTGFANDVSSLVAMSPDGAWGAWATNESGTLNPEYTGATSDGTPWVDDGVTVQQPGKPATRFTFQLTPDSSVNTFIWETDRTILVTILDDPDGNTWHYIRCTISTHKCELAPTP